MNQYTTMTAEKIHYLTNTTKTEYLCHNQNLHQKTNKVLKNPQNHYRIKPITTTTK